MCIGQVNFGWSVCGIEPVGFQAQYRRREVSAVVSRWGLRLSAVTSVRQIGATESE